MLLSFQRQVAEEQMAKQRQRDFRRSVGASQADQASATSGTAEGASPDRPSLFLKNSSAHLPPRRQQLAVSNVHGGASDEATSPQNQYQLAMGEALARHEQELLRVREIKKLQ